MNEFAKYGLYFLIGGTLISVSTYLGSHGKGFMAAVGSTVPIMSGLTFILIFLNSGNEVTLSFAKHLIWVSPPWFLYVGCMIYGIHRWGFWTAFSTAFGLYMMGVWVMRLIIR